MRVFAAAVVVFSFALAAGCPDTNPSPVDDDDVAIGDDDAVDDDDAAPVDAHAPFHSAVSGGAVLATDRYRLELFVMPTEPVGAASTSAYQVRLGPGALRAAALPETPR